MNDLPPPHPELTELREIQTWAQGLARSLVGDVHLADDVVQEALVASLGSAAAIRSPRAWLGGTIRRLAAGTRRDRARRRLREEVSAPREALPSAAETAGRLESQGILIDALLAMDEPFRGALMARYIDGLPPRSIAERDRVPVATVNSRLSRGLLRLRAVLKQRHGGDETRWIAALTPILPSLPMATVPVASKGAASAGVFLMKKALLALAAFALLIPVGRRLLSGGAESGVPGHTVQGSLAQQPAEIPPDSAPGAVGDSEGFGRRVSVSTARPPERLRDDGLDGAPPQRIQVLDVASGDPVGGADIHVIAHGAMMAVIGPGKPSVALGEWPGAMRTAMEQHGRHFETNADGYANVPVPEEGSYAVIQKGDLWGEEALYRRRGDRAIYVGTDLRVQVEVVDGARAKLEGAAVHLQVQVREGDQLVTYDVARAQTGATDSTAVAELLLSRSTLGEFPLADPETCRWFVTLEGETEAPGRLEVFPEDWPVKPVTLMRRAGRALTVELGGRTLAEQAAAARLGFTDGAVVQLLTLTNGRALTASSFGAFGHELVDGRCTIQHVAAGQDVAAVLWPGAPGLPFNGVGRCPADSSAEESIELDPMASDSRVFGRLVDHRGAPAAGLRLPVSVAEHMWIPEGLATDAEGRFEWRVRLDEPPYLNAGLLIQGPGPESRTVTLSPERLSSALRGVGGAGGGVDLGDIVLPGPAPKASSIKGRVVDVNGAGIPGAAVHWVEVEPGEDGSYTWAGRARVQSDGAGRFEIEEIELGPTVGLLATSLKEHYHSPVPFRGLEVNPDGEVLVRVAEGATLVGGLLLDPGIPVAALQVETWPLARGPLPPYTGRPGWRSATLEDGGGFRIAGLRPGRYAVRAGIGEDHVDAVIVEVEAPGGEASVLPIDLRGKLGRFVARVVDERGRRLKAHASMLSRETFLDRDVYGFPELLGTVERGRPIVFGARPGVRILVEAEGHFSAVIDPLDAPEEVVLHRGIDVELRVEGAAAVVAEAPGDLVFKLTALETGPKLPRGIRSALTANRMSRAVCGSDGTAKLRVPGPGEYVVSVEIDYEARTGYHIQRELASEAPFVLTVGGSLREVGAYLVPLDQGAFESALKRVRSIFHAWIANGTLPEGQVFGTTHRN